MLKFTVNQDSKKRINEDLNKKTVNSHIEIPAEFTTDDKRYNENEKAIIFAMVRQGELKIILGIDQDGYKIRGDIHQLTENEIELIKQQLDLIGFSL